MPLREYKAADAARSCDHCLGGFEVLERADTPAPSACPRCGSPVVRVFSAPRVGSSAGSLDQRAKNAGFHKLKRLGKGEYEKQY